MNSVYEDELSQPISLYQNKTIQCPNDKSQDDDESLRATSESKETLDASISKC